MVNTATGVIPLGVMPVQEAAPGMMGLVAASAQASACLRCVLEARDAYEGETGTPLTSGKKYRPPCNATPNSR